MLNKLGSEIACLYASVYLCSNGDVCVNWTPITKNGTALKTGDMVSVRGKGRLKVSCQFQ